MNSVIASNHIQSLLGRMFEQSELATSPDFESVPPAERERLLRSKTEYTALYGRLRNLWLPVSRQTGELLYMLARSTRSKTVVEFGTSFGISTVFLAAALRENGGGRLISTEFEPSKVLRARQHLVEAGLDDLVEIREGDALKTLAHGVPEGVDLVLLDGAKALYADVLDLVQSHLRPGALIVADNADHCPEYMARVRAPGSGFMSVPFAEDVELTLRLA